MGKQISITRKIAVVIPKYGLVGGAEGFAASLTEQLARDSAFEIHVFANRWSKHKLQEGISFHPVPIIPFPKFLKTISFAIFAQNAIGRIGVDIIHAHDRMLRPDLYSIHGIPHRIWVKDIRRKNYPSLFDRTTSWVERRMVVGGTCRYFLAVSRLTRDVFLKEYPMSVDRVPVVHPGIDPLILAKERNIVDRHIVRRQYGLPIDTPLILFVSMNFDIKGLDPLLAGLGRLRALYPAQPFHLLVVGGDKRGKYELMAAKAAIADRVTFSGTVSTEKLTLIYAAGDLYAMLSKFDTFGMVVLEAMARGLPVVLSSNVGASDLVRENVNGFVIAPPLDADKVAQVIFQALQPELKVLMGKAALATAREFTWERSARQVTEIYRNIEAKKNAFTIRP